MTAPSQDASSAGDPFDPVEEAIAEIAAGRLVIVTDDEGRENEGDLIMAASLATPETVNMMIRYGSGIVCVPTTEAQLRRLNLQPMVPHNRESMRTDFTASVDAAEGISTGISAPDRTRTIRIVADPTATPDQLVQPGHVFPLRGRPGGVLERAGHTEAAVDLARLAGLPPAGVLCEIVNDDGSVARLPELIEFKNRHGLKIISIAALIEFRHQREQLIERVHEQPFRHEHGEFRLHTFRSTVDGTLHYALSLGTPDPNPTLVRVHGENVLRDVFGPRGGEGSDVVATALRRIAEEGRGVFLYMSRPCSGTAMRRALETSDLGESRGLTAAPMDFRAYGIGAQILCALGLRSIRLLSSSRRNVVGLEGYGLEIVEQIPLLNPGSPASQNPIRM